MRLNIGAGYAPQEEYKSVDIDPDTNPDYLIRAEDIGDHFEKDSIEEIRAFHVLEHIPPRELFHTLRGWWKVLKPGGLIHVEVPDCKHAIELWVQEEINDCCLLKTILGSDPDATPYMVHRNMFWFERLDRYLTITGYVHIAICIFDLNLNCTAKKPEAK